MRPASDAERARLNDTFAALCRIPSPFGHERECSERVRAELRAMRIEAEEDAAGNLLARLGPDGDGGVLLCAHLDTVIPVAPVDPVCEECASSAITANWRPCSSGRVLMWLITASND